MYRRLLAIPLAGLLAAGLTVATSQGATAQPAAPQEAAPAAPVAATPPMGWNDWYAFQCNLNEPLIEQTADTMVSSGMQAAGYQYVNLDDCWLSHNRDANGNLQADPVKFPHGIKAVADYVHARGLKLGIYEDVGTATCAGYPGSYGHVQQDADTFASWGIDFVKVDWCNVPFGDFPGMSQQDVAKKLYTAYSQALKATGRPMLFSICEWNPALQPWTWAPAISNMWRTNNDYGDTWDQIVANLDQEAALAPFAGPGHWNDPDILQVGLGRTSAAQDQAHFSAWSMLAAPLLAGNDLRSMSAASKAILTNREVIAIDQDPLGAEATRLSHDGDADVWTRTLANGDRAVMLLNRGTVPLSIGTDAQALGLPKLRRVPHPRPVGAHLDGVGRPDRRVRPAAERGAVPGGAAARRRRQLPAGDGRIGDAGRAARLPGFAVSRCAAGANRVRDREPPQRRAVRDHRRETVAVRARRVDGRGRFAHCRVAADRSSIRRDLAGDSAQRYRPRYLRAHRECQLPMGRRHAGRVRVAARAGSR